MKKQLPLSQRAGAVIASAEIIPESGLGLTFRANKKVSPYLQLLERLLNAPKGNVLKVSGTKARPSIIKCAKKLGFKVEFAERDGTLYVRINGVAREDAKPITPSADHCRAIMEALKAGPLTALELVRVLKIDIGIREVALRDLEQRGKLQREGTGGSAVYRLAPLNARRDVA